MFGHGETAAEVSAMAVETSVGTAIGVAVARGFDHVHSRTYLRTDGNVPERALERKDDKVYCIS